MPLEIPTLYQLRVHMPGLAGRYQDEGSTAALIAELGDNYSVYHTYLGVELATFVRPPVAEDFPDRDGYFAAWQRIQNIIMAEAFIRACRAFRLENRPLGTALDTSVPLISLRDNHLVSVVLNDA